MDLAGINYDCNSFNNASRLHGYCNQMKYQMQAKDAYLPFLESCTARILNAARDILQNVKSESPVDSCGCEMETEDVTKELRILSKDLLNVSSYLKSLAPAIPVNFGHISVSAQEIHEIGAEMLERVMSINYFDALCGKKYDNQVTFNMLPMELIHEIIKKGVLLSMQADLQ